MADTYQTMPTWLMDMYRSLYGQAASVAGQEFTPYQEARLAAPTADTLASQQAVRQAQGQWQPYYQQGLGALSQAQQLAQGSATYDPAKLQQHLSPYTSGVVDEIARLGTRNLQENILPGINSTFTGAGQFGSTRNADFTNRAIRDVSRDIAGQQANALNTAYTNSNQNYLDWSKQGLGGASSLGQTAGGLSALASAGQGSQYKDIAAQEAIGNAQRQDTQSQLNLAYQDFLQQQQYPQTQLGWWSNLMAGNSAPLTAGSPVTMTSSGTTSTTGTAGYTTPGTPGSSGMAGVGPLLSTIL